MEKNSTYIEYPTGRDLGVNDVEISELLQKAKQSLEAAKLLLKDSFADFSAARTYYSMFYSVEALMLCLHAACSNPEATGCVRSPSRCKEVLNPLLDTAVGSY